MIYEYCPFCGAEYDSKNESVTDDYPNSLKCLKCGKVFYNNPKPAAAGLLFSDGKILLVKRKFEPYKGYWGLPGGFVVFGETLDQAIKREMKEELGLDISIEGIKGTFNIVYPISKKDNFSVSVIVYDIKAEETDSIKCNDDVEEYAFYNDKSILSKIAFQGQKDFLEKYIFDK